MSNTNIEYEEVLFDEMSEEGTDAPEVMTEEEIEAAVAKMIIDCASYSDTVLSPARREATDYYKARPFGDEEEGRSQYVSTDVRNSVGGIMPSIMRLFFGPERIVEFGPQGEGDEDGARLRTDYVNHIIEKDNNGFLVLYSAVKDALIRKLGIVKWFWDDTVTEEEHSIEGITEDQLIILEADDTLDVYVSSQYSYTDPLQIAAYTKVRAQYEAALEQGIPSEELGPPPQQPQPVSLFNVEVVRHNAEGRARIMAVPPEEFLYSSDARSLEEARAVFHRRDLPKSDILAMGIDPDLVDEVVGTGKGSYSELKSNEEAIARYPSELLDPSERAPEDEDIPFFEGYVYLNLKGTGVAHYKVRCIGTGMKLVDYAKESERPFALFMFDPEPHTLDALSAADHSMDLQLVKSKVVRGSLDSLAFSLHPRTAIVEGQVNLKDVLNTEIGSVIRMRAPGMVQEFGHQFNGAAAFPFLEYFDSQLENRLGISKAAAGLDPDSLQSTTRAAVAATVTGAQQHLDLFARILVETGLKALMSGLLRLVVKHQNFARTVRMNNRWVEVDPRVWNVDMDVEVNVAMGLTLTEERLAALKELAAQQKELISTMGPGNPFVSFGQFSYTLRRIAELSGHRDTSRYWNELPLDFNPEPPPPKPAPEEVLAQAQAQKVQNDAQQEQAELQLKAQEIQMREQRERDRIEADMYLRAKEIELKYKAQNAKITAELEAKLASMKAKGDSNDE